MNRRLSLYFLALGSLGCARSEMRLSLPPPSEKCAIDHISRIDQERFHLAMSPIGPSHAKSPYAINSCGDAGLELVAYSDFYKPWDSPDSTYCLRQTVIRSPHCPTPEGSLDCRNDFNWWQGCHAGLFTALQRIQFDQKSCRLATLYDEFLSYPHTDEEKAGVCLGMLVFDPEMYPCLESNKAALRKLVTTRQRSDRQTYATLLFNHAFIEQGIPLWDHDYDAAFAWIYSNLFPLMNSRQDDFASLRHHHIAAISAFRSRDSDALMRVIAAASHGKGSVLTELELLARLEIHGDEGKKLLAYGGKPGIDEMWSGILRSRENLKRRSPPDYDPIRPFRCQY